MFRRKYTEYTCLFLGYADINNESRAVSEFGTSLITLQSQVANQSNTIASLQVEVSGKMYSITLLVNYKKTAYIYVKTFCFESLDRY